MHLKPGKYSTHIFIAIFIYYFLQSYHSSTAQVVTFKDTSARESFFPLMHKFKAKAEAQEAQ